MTNFQHDSTCIVCLDQMKQAKVLPCKHYFHDECLRNWLQQFNSCPMCKASVNLNDEKKQNSDKKQQQDSFKKLDQNRGKHRTDKLKFDIKRLERYKQLGRKQDIAARSQQRRESNIIQPKCSLDQVNQNSQQPLEDILHVNENQLQTNKINQNCEPNGLGTRRSEIIQEDAKERVSEQNQNSKQNINNFMPPFNRDDTKNQSKNSAPDQLNQFSNFNYQKGLLQKEAIKRLNERKQSHKKQRKDLLNSDINVGSVIYGLPRPPPTRRTIQSQINRTLIEIINAKFSVLYKRPPSSGIPSDILQALRKKKKKKNQQI